MAGGAAGRKKSGAGRIVAQLLERPQDLQATLALGNTFANAAILAAALRMVFDAQWAFGLTMLALAAVVLLVGEVLPKTLAVRQPERWALRVAWPLLVFRRVTKPFYRAAQWTNAAILRQAAAQPAPPAAVTEAEYQELLELAWQQGTLEESEREIILQIISLDRRTARDVMRPRAGMACDFRRRDGGRNARGGAEIQAPPPADLRRNAGHHRRHTEHAGTVARPED